jgi:hypothetical protein
MTLQLGLTLFNKIVLVSFPYPYVRLFSARRPQGSARLTLPSAVAPFLQTLTGLHALSGCIGSYIALERGHFVRRCPLAMGLALLSLIHPSPACAWVVPDPCPSSSRR